MGKGMKAGKSKRKGSVKVSRAELNAAEKKFDRWLDSAKTDATLDASKYVYALVFEVLHNKFGFEEEQIAELYQGVDDLSDAITSGTYTWEELYESLGSIGVYMGEE